LYICVSKGNVGALSQISGKVFIGPEPVLDNCPVINNFEGLWPYVWPQHSTKHLHVMDLWLSHMQ
jgi:hypothetical protein